MGNTIVQVLDITSAEDLERFINNFEINHHAVLISMFNASIKDARHVGCVFRKLNDLKDDSRNY